MEYRKLGKFRLDRSVAKGGMGEILKSTDEAGRVIALKSILEDFSTDPKFRDLFIREAEITFQLDHPNIIKAYRFDEWGKRLVLAMEYLDGVNLKDVLRKLYENKLRMPLSVACSIMHYTLKGLQYAHEKRDRLGRKLGIIHRDLNPSNIFLTYQGDIKILDFGISKATQIDFHQLTPKNELRGKVSYLAPEQIRDLELDHRVDIFSLGIVLWEILAGRPLFMKDTDAEVMELILGGKYPTLKKFRPDLPEAVDAVIKRALQVDPAKRFSSAKEFERALSAACARSFMPGVDINDVSVFVRSLFQSGPMPDNSDFQSTYSWLMTQMPGLESKGLLANQDLAKKFPTRPLIQLNYAKALLLRGDRSEGIRRLRRLARADLVQTQVQKILEDMGVRRKPVITFLKRSNPLNHGLGWIRHQILGKTPYQDQFLAA